MELWKDIEAVKELIRVVKEAGVDFKFEEEDGDSDIKRKISIKAKEQPAVSLVSPMGFGMAENLNLPPQGSPSVEFTPITSHGASVNQAEAENTWDYADNSLKIVTSPLVGTFYSAASPEDEPFVKVGDRVTKGQQLGIIEAMKLMNEINSEFDGEVAAVLVSNESVVEYGQPLFKIKCFDK